MCHVMSCHVMPCHRRERADVMSCRVVSCRVMSCHVMSCHVMSCHVSVLEKMIEHQSSLIANLMRPRAEEKVETGVQACMTIPRKIDDRSFANVNLRWPQNHHRFHVMSCIGPRNDDRASIVFDRELDAAARGRERRDWGTSPQVC